MYRFESWIKSQNLKEDIIIVFEESIKCYQSEAYRAALLFGFIGFQKILRDRLLNSNAPSSYSSTLSDWEEKIIEKLKNDDSYEKVIIKAVLEPLNNKDIFKLNKGVLNQYQYWKDRRNECAHGKKGFISKETVISLWDFIILYNKHFYVDGGINALLNKLKRYLNDDYTSPDLKADHIIKDIPMILNSQELDLVYTLLSDELEKLKKLSSNDARHMKLYTNVIEALLNLEAPYSEVIKRYLYEDLNQLIEILCVDQELIHFVNDKETVRAIWKKGLFINVRKSIDIISSLLAYNKIPKNQFKELAEHTFDYYYAMSLVNLTDTDINILKGSHFAEELRIKVFENDSFDLGQFNEANSKQNIVTLCLEISNLTESNLRKLYGVFDYSSHPYDLKDTLNYRLRNRPSFSEKLRNEFDDSNVPVPSNIIFLS